MQPITNTYQIFWEETRKYIKGIMEAIDWGAISDAAAETLTELDTFLQKYEENYWCFDYEIMDLIGEDEINEESIIEYVESKLESYIAEITKDPLFELHVTLINETYEAYKLGLYKLCAMPLFAVFEHIIASWREGNIKEGVIEINKKPKLRRLFKIIDPDKFNEVEHEQFSKIFALSVLRMFKKTFVNVPENLCQNLNRNSLTHGFHDYNSITKVDILKLFQLLKASMVLKYYDINVNERYKITK
ncbi:hypothetical protein DN410_02980 [Bacillus sp. SH5-2]|nr:hypothetical protein DN410_02980 [Bacillus sp. SH5-2]